VFPDGFAGRMVFWSVAVLGHYVSSPLGLIGRLMAENVGIMVVYGAQTEHQLWDDERRFFARLHRVAALRV
jgi:hypothetical protein